jgi:ribosomal 30S subunit maturation factor RimM
VLELWPTGYSRAAARVGCLLRSFGVECHVRLFLSTEEDTSVTDAKGERMLEKACTSSDAQARRARAENVSITWDIRRDDAVQAAAAFRDSFGDGATNG